MEFLNQAYEFFIALNPIIKIIIGILIIGILFSIIKKFIKVAIWLTVLAILIVILYRLIQTV